MLLISSKFWKWKKKQYFSLYGCILLLIFWKELISMYLTQVTRILLQKGRVAPTMALVVSFAAVQCVLSIINSFKLFQICRALTNCYFQVTVKICTQVLLFLLKLACVVPYCHRRGVTMPWCEHSHPQHHFQDARIPLFRAVLAHRMGWEIYLS